MKWLNDVDGDKLVILGIFIIVFTVVVSVTSCTLAGNNSAEELMKNGATAAEVNCAIYRGQDVEVACLSAMSAKK